MIKQMIVLSTVAAATATGLTIAVREYKQWGTDPETSAEPLPGDNLVTEPTAIDTRSIEIAAPPEQVWPWLVQMGYRRAGWYSYDAFDMVGSSKREILPEFQALEVGQVMPTHDEGGFVVKVLEPNRSLVLYLDSATVNEQEAARGDMPEGSVAAGDHHPEANIQATGKFLGAAVPGEFAASWAFTLEPTASGGTKLIERFRVSTEGPGRFARPALPRILGFGVFAMTRRQMLGIKERAEAGPPPGRIQTEPVLA
jgi:hypothetical protein